MTIVVALQKRIAELERDREEWIEAGMRVSEKAGKRIGELENQLTVLREALEKAAEFLTAGPTLDIIEKALAATDKE